MPSEYSFVDMSMPAVYGIATTFVEWVFTKYEDRHVIVSESVIVDRTQPDSIKKFIGRIVALLQLCKKDVNPEHSVE